MPEEIKLSLTEAGLLFKQKKDRLALAKNDVAEIQREYDNLRKSILPELMEVEGVESVNLTGIGKISLRAEVYASIRADSKLEAFAWLEENGFPDTIKPGVNSSTLKALIKECLGNGVELPEDLFSISPYIMAVLTKN